MSRPLQIAVSGPADAGADLERAAEEVGRLLAEAGARVVCGGYGGVMEAVSRGAAGAGGEVIGILSSASPDDANQHVTHPVATGIGQARNLAVVASADAVIAVGGSWGTLSEIAFAHRLGRPVVGLESWELSPGGGVSAAEPARDPAAAVAGALQAARSSRHDV